MPWALTLVFFAAAVAGWWPRIVGPENAGVALTASQWRAEHDRLRMLEAGARIGHWHWSSELATGSGDVVWDPAKQQGFLMLRGFPSNDPAHSRYQLWIFDAARDERYPVDGGLFDVPPGQQTVVVPVRPGVHVSRPTAFAVTVEKPGGVVVSDRSALVAIARTGG